MFLQHVPEALPKRRITEEVCRTNGYGVARYHGKQVQVADYRDAKGKLVAQKIKTPEKDFSILGDAKAMTLWPQHRWRPGGKRLLITEGETDLLCWQSISGDRYPAVSIPNGAPAAKKAIARSLEWVESFEQVILCFDADEPGRKAAQEVCEMLSPGKAAIMQLPAGCKDICEAAQEGFSEKLIDAFWQAQPFRPDGVVGSDELLKALLNPPTQGIPYPWNGLNKILLGLRQRELVTLTAGTGVGKSLVAGLLAHSLIKRGIRVGYISLEESLTRTAERLMAAEIKKPIHVDRSNVTTQEMEEVWHRVFAGRVVVFNHFGSLDADGLLKRIRYMRVAEGVDFVFVDHLSILVSGWGDGDERRLIDNVMTALRSICEQTGVGMVLISHLRAPAQGAKSHEEGGRPKLNELRGSKSISQLSDAVIALVRDQMDEEGHQHRSEVWVLKNRFTGVIGRACTLSYDTETTELKEVDVTDGSSYGF